MNELGKPIKFEDVQISIAQYPVTYLSTECVTRGDGTPLYHRGHPVMREVTEYHVKTVERPRYLVLCPDGVVRWLKPKEIVNRFGKKQFRKARRNWRRRGKIVDPATLLPEAEDVNS